MSAIVNAMPRYDHRQHVLSDWLAELDQRFQLGEVFFFFYEWEHRTGTMCPFSSLHPLKKGKEV